LYASFDQWSFRDGGGRGRRSLEVELHERGRVHPRLDEAERLAVVGRCRRSPADLARDPLGRRRRPGSGDAPGVGHAGVGQVTQRVDVLRVLGFQRVFVDLDPAPVAEAGRLDQVDAAVGQDRDEEVVVDVRPSIDRRTCFVRVDLPRR